jgi:hypothetical protein
VQTSPASLLNQGRGEDIALAQPSSTGVDLPRSGKRSMQVGVQGFPGSFGDAEDVSPTKSSVASTSCESSSMEIFSANSTPSSQRSVSSRKILSHSTTQELSGSHVFQERRPEHICRPTPTSAETPSTPIELGHSHNVNSVGSVPSRASFTENGAGKYSSPGTRPGNLETIPNIHQREPSKGQTSDPYNSSPVKNTPFQNEKSSESIVPDTTIPRKRRVEEFSGSTPLLSAPPPKISKLSGIQNYFKPLPRSSSPPILRSTLHSSDSIEPPEQSTPPSSPPPSEDPLFAHSKKSQKRQRRRLTTKPTLEPLDSMSYRSSNSVHLDDEDRPSFSEMAGGADDSAGVSLVEEYLDEDEKDDLRRSELVSERNRARSDWYRRTGLSSSHGNSSVNTGSTSLPKPSVGGASPVRPSARPRGVSQPLMGSIRGDRTARPSLRSSRNASYSEAGPSSPSVSLTRHRNTIMGNRDLYDHKEQHEPESAPINPSQALWKQRHTSDFAPYKPSHTLAIPMAPKKKNESTGYHQLQIDLGITQSINCDKCKMLYNPFDPMDKRAHDEFCRSTSLPELPRRISNNDRALCEKIVHGEQHQIRVYGRTSPQAQRVHAQQVLDATYKDLEGLRYTDDELSAEVLDPLQTIDPGMVPRFKLYVYYVGRKVVGALLVERFHQFESRALVERSGMCPWGKKHVIFDRLWVAAAYRRLGYARALADNARADFIPGLRVPKEAVAMPEQTEMGRGFARSYFA